MEIGLKSWTGIASGPFLRIKKRFERGRGLSNRGIRVKGGEQRERREGAVI